MKYTKDNRHICLDVSYKIRKWKKRREVNKEILPKDLCYKVCIIGYRKFFPFHYLTLCLS